MSNNKSSPQPPPIFHDPSQPLLLSSFRDVLIRQEETIVFALIERAQFPINEAVYKTDSDGVMGDLRLRGSVFQGSFLDFMFSETERLHSLVRRYTSPDENPFYPQSLCEPLLTKVNYPTIIQPNSININPKIKTMYLKKILPLICASGDDSREEIPGQYGSTACADIAVLQAISKRIHYGKFIAEAKFQAEREKYEKLILANDAEAIMAELTKPDVEERVCRRVLLKASSYGQDIDVDKQESKNYKVDPQVISDLYRDHIMPLTKEVQVAYLLQRLRHDTVAYLGSEFGACYDAACKHFGPKAENFVAHADVGDIFTAVMSNHVAYGVIPFEDSDQGMIKTTQQYLISSSLYICAQITVKKEYCLGVLESGSPLSKIERVFVPRKILSECRLWISQNLPRAEVVSVDWHENELHTSNLDKQSAAIATIQAVRSASLTPLVSDIPFMDNGSTRYAVISKSLQTLPSGKDKASLALFVDHSAGSLAKSLTAFSKHDVNLCRLEAVSIKGKTTHFFVEIEGHLDEKSVQRALQDLEELGNTNVKVLGSYAAEDLGESSSPPMSNGLM